MIFTEDYISNYERLVKSICCSMKKLNELDKKAQSINFEYSFSDLKSVQKVYKCETIATIMQDSKSVVDSLNSDRMTDHRKLETIENTLYDHRKRIETLIKEIED